MDDALLVSRLEGVGDLARDSEGVIDGKPSGAPANGERRRAKGRWFRPFSRWPLAFGLLAVNQVGECGPRSGSLPTDSGRTLMATARFRFVSVAR
jgi:hypothetical protein